ncbi:MAG: hypothetical protein ACOVOR_02300 [Rhabdochlamydiaceae bacterium]
MPSISTTYSITVNGLTYDLSFKKNGEVKGCDENFWKISAERVKMAILAMSDKGTVDSLTFSPSEVKGEFVDKKKFVYSLKDESATAAKVSEVFDKFKLFQKNGQPQEVSLTELFSRYDQDEYRLEAFHQEDIDAQITCKLKSSPPPSLSSNFEKKIPPPLLEKCIDIAWDGNCGPAVLAHALGNIQNPKDKQEIKKEQKALRNEFAKNFQKKNLEETQINLLVTALKDAQEFVKGNELKDLKTFLNDWEKAKTPDEKNRSIKQMKRFYADCIEQDGFHVDAPFFDFFARKNNITIHIWEGNHNPLTRKASFGQGASSLNLYFTPGHYQGFLADKVISNPSLENLVDVLNGGNCGPASLAYALGKITSDMSEEEKKTQQSLLRKKFSKKFPKQNLDEDQKANLVGLFIKAKEDLQISITTTCEKLETLGFRNEQALLAIKAYDLETCRKLINNSTHEDKNILSTIINDLENEIKQHYINKDYMKEAFKLSDDLGKDQPSDEQDKIYKKMQALYALFVGQENFWVDGPFFAFFAQEENKTIRIWKKGQNNLEVALEINPGHDVIDLYFDKLHYQSFASNQINASVS